MAGPTIRDVAQLAKVSIGTVSRVLNGHKSVSGDVRTRVSGAIARLRYEPDQVAQSMRLRVTRTVACATRDISIPGFGSIVKGAEEVLRAQSYTLLLAVTDDRKEREMELLRMFMKRRVDAVITTTSSEDDSDLSEQLEKLKVPVVLLDRDLPENLDAVIVDHQAGLRAATEYLIEMGHLRIALITGRPTTRPARERIAGFRNALAGKEEVHRQSVVRAVGFTSESGFLETSSLLSVDNRPTAIIAGGMAMLPGVMEAVRAKNLRIPEDISIIAGADTDLARLAQPPITAIRWNELNVGRLAAQLLLDRLADTQGENSRRHIMVPTELITRRSCARPLDASAGRRLSK